MIKNNNRIISLYPSASDFIIDLNLKNQLVAVSHECNNKNHFNKIPKVTSTILKSGLSQAEINFEVEKTIRKNEPLYKIDVNLINNLKPTHIITQGLCDVCAVSSKTIEVFLKGVKYNLDSKIDIISLNGNNFMGICEDIQYLGTIFNKNTEAQTLINYHKKKWVSLKKGINSKTLLLLEWTDPPFSSGHWIPEMVELAGFKNLLSSSGEISKKISWENIKKSNPDYIGVICCGFDFNQNKKAAKDLYKIKMLDKVKAIRNENIFAFDSNAFFSKPSLKIVEGAELICNILNSNENENRCYRPIC